MLRNFLNWRLTTSKLFGVTHYFVDLFIHLFSHHYALTERSRKIKSLLRAPYLELILHADWWEEAGMKTTAAL